MDTKGLPVIFKLIETQALKYLDLKINGLRATIKINGSFIGI